MDFEFNVCDDHAEIVRYNGKSTEVIIPEEYNGVPVTYIYGECFSCSDIESIVGNSIKIVGHDAFYDCYSLTSVILPVCVNIGDNAFYNCESLTEVNLSVCKYIGYAAFWNCSSLTGITLPDCKSIGDLAFAYCYSLTEISLPVCKSIGSYAFEYCSSFTSITLPVCEYVYDFAFTNCTSLTNVNLPACKSVGKYAFYDCTNLVKVGKYKATTIDLTCRGFKYKIRKWFEENEAILCEKGFHYVENFYDIFNYYWGKLGQDLRIFEVEAEEISDERKDDSKRVCRKIKLVKEIKSYRKFF